jgi:integrase
VPRRRGKRWTASGYDPAVGRKRHLGTFDTRGEARDAEDDWRRRAKSSSREACDKFAERWTTDYPRPRASTNTHNAERVQAFGRDFKGIRLGDVDKPTARKWAIKHPSNVPAVRAMFGDAERDGLIAANPFANLRLPGSKGRKNIVALTEGELVELAALCRDPRMELGDFGPLLEAMTLFAGFVGLRPGELYALKASKVGKGLARIDTPTKTDQPRTVVVPRPAQDAIHGLPLNASGLLFESPRGKPWTTGSHSYYWRKLRLIANRPNLAFYELRHCAATLLLERGVSPWDVAVQLGHTDGGWLVQNLYGHPSEDAARARVAAAYESDVVPLRAASGARREQA